MTTINERLDEMWARADAATEGPWSTYQSAYGTGVEVGAEGEQLFVETMGLTYPPNPADAEFIAASRDDLPDVVAALQAVLALHAPTNMPVNRCRHDRLPYHLCPTVRAIADALGVQP